MQHQAYVERVVDLIDPSANVIFNMTVDQAIQHVGSGDPDQVGRIDGQFALLHRRGKIVRLARSIGRPMRYFMAKRTEGPCLIVAERIDQIRQFLDEEGLGGQFHPSYTRMVPAHHIVEIALVGCPDPSPQVTRFLAPPRDALSQDLNEIGRAYIGALAAAIDHWLDGMDASEPVGVLFSGGVDSGAVLLVTHHLMLRRGQTPTRLKAFTLAVDGGGDDVRQASRFLSEVDLGLLLETVEVAREALDYRDAVRVIEDYKPLDVQAATMGMALCRGIRKRYPDWRFLLDGDGGDENLRDYPIEENPELTIRSVLSNPLFYHEGWGVDALKHSLTYSGGQSRGHVRTFAPARLLGFDGFSPFAVPSVIGVAEGIPFVSLTDWDHQRLYALKGEVTRCGVEAVTGITMPVFDKRRFQRGAIAAEGFEASFPSDEGSYRKAFAELYEKDAAGGILGK